MTDTIDTNNKSALLKQTVMMTARAQHDRKTEEIKNAFSAFVNEVKQFPELLFLSEFYPLFSGTAEYDENRLKMWYSISGGPFEPVDLIDGDNNVVYRVPAVLDRSVLKLSDASKSNGVGVLFKHYSNMLQVSPQSAEAIVANELSIGLVNKNVDPESQLIKDWQALLNRYSKNNVPDNVSTKQSRTNDSAIDFEF